MIVAATYARIANSDDYDTDSEPPVTRNKNKSKGKTVKTPSLRTKRDGNKVDNPVDHLFDDDHSVEDGRASGDNSDVNGHLDDDDWHDIEEELRDPDSFNRQVAFEVCAFIYRLQHTLSIIHSLFRPLY
jgi:hypothetical protein